MRIQHNIAALNSWGKLGINQNNAAKNLEKLSSGYRINRAGDDAAGLAISEKMRGQIRGLDMASKNAQDGISLIQTAEGALDETHSILQRMRELAVQSANGTYQDEDRQQINLEIDALKSEIDRISSATHFNKIQLLDGSLGSGSKVSSKAAVDPSTSVSSSSAVAGGANATPLGQTGAGMTIDPLPVTATIPDGKSAVYEITFATGASSLDGPTTVTFNYNDANGDAQAVGLSLTLASTDDADAIATKFMTAFNANAISTSFTVATTSANNVLTLTAKGTLANDKDVTIGNITADGTLLTGTAAVSTPGVDNSLTRKFDLANAKAGDTITINDTTFELVAKGGTAAKGNVAVAYDELDQAVTTRNLWEAIHDQNIDGIKNAIIGNNHNTPGPNAPQNTQITLVGTKGVLEDVKIDTTARPAIGLTVATNAGTDNYKGGHVAIRKWTFSTASAAGSLDIVLNKLDDTGATVAATLTLADISASTSGKEIAEMIANKVNTAQDLKDADGNALYNAWVGDDGALFIEATNAASNSYDIAVNAIAATITDATTLNYGENQTGKAHDQGGTGASAVLDFSNAKIGDVFSVGDKTYEIVNDAKKDAPLTAGATALQYNSDKEAMIKDLLRKTGSFYETGGDKYTLTQNDSKLTITNKTIGEDESVVPVVQLGSVGTNAKIEVGGAVVDFGKSAALNGYNINIVTGDKDKAEIDKDNKTINVTLKEGATAQNLKTALKTALANSGDQELEQLAADGIKVTGELKVGTEGENAATIVTFKDSIKAGDTVTIGDKTYQIGKAGDTVKEGNELLAVEADADGNISGAAVAKALADIASDKYTAVADGNKLTLTAADGAEAKDIQVAVNDSRALTFQIGANGSADQRVSLNIEDMSSVGIGVNAIDILTADTANQAIDVVDNAINTVSATRANLGAMQNRLEHTINSLNTTSENLTAAESRIRDVDMAKEMMAFTKNNILTQAAQAMLAQANQQPQGVLQLLQ